MSYHDLPDDWDDLPLDDPTLLADVVDLFLSASERRQGTLLALVTGPDLRLLAPVKIDELPIDCPEREQAACVDRLVDLVQHLAAHGGLALGIGRAGQVVQTHWDSAWQRHLVRACTGERVTALGCVLATPAGAVPLDAAVAAA